MSEPRKRCPNGERYNKETKRCEPNGKNTTRKASVTTSPKSTSPKSPSPKSPSPKSTSTRKSPPRAMSSRATSPPEVESFILHEGGDSYRLLVSIPVNDRDLWPTDNICYFRTSGRSNEGYEKFRGSWFPIAGIKDDSNMPDYLPDKAHGFFIKMVFITEDFETPPNWIYNLIMDYPIILDEDERVLFENKSIITISEFRSKILPIVNDFVNKKISVLNNRYERIALRVNSIIDDAFDNFLTYFLYEWQAMLSLKIGGGYWAVNTEFTAYISTKLTAFDSVHVPIINKILYNANETELKVIYELDPTNNKDTNRGQPSIEFSKNAKTQLSLDQIMTIKAKQEIDKGTTNTGMPKIFSKFYTYKRVFDRYLLEVANIRKNILDLPKK